MSEDEDPWNVRIAQTGCFAENERLQLCRYDTGDWRQCLAEMKAFRECWQRHSNRERVQTVDLAPEQRTDFNLTGEKHDQ